MRCKGSHVPYFASILAAGQFVAEPKSFILKHWQQGETGHWADTTTNGVLAKEHVKIEDQIVFPNMERIFQNQHLYQRFTLDQRLSTRHTLPYAYSPLLPSPESDTGGTGQLMPYYSTLPSQALVALSPSIEKPLVEDMLKGALGHHAPRYMDVMHQSGRLIQKWNLPFGVGLSDAQIATLEQPVVLPVLAEIRIGNETISALVPIVYLDKYSVTVARSGAKNIVRARFIELAVKDDVVIQGAVEATRDNLRLYARKIANHGEIKSAKDIELLADETLLIETLVDEVTGRLAGKASVVAEGKVHLAGEKGVRSLASEVVGEDIIVRSGTDIVIIPKQMLTEFKDEIKEGFSEERRSIFCKDYVSNHWDAGKTIDIQALNDVTIAGQFKAKDLIKIEATEGDLVVDEIKKICHEEIEKTQGGWAWLNGKWELVRKDVEDAVKTGFETAGAWITKSGRDTKLTGIDVSADTADISAGRNLDVKGGKSKTESATDAYANNFFERGQDGRYYVWGHERSGGRGYDEKIEKNIFNVRNAYLRADGKINWAGADLYANQTATISGKSGVHVYALDEEHRHSTATTQGGFAVGATLDAGEASVSAGIGINHGNDNHRGKKKVGDVLSVGQGLKIDSQGNVYVEAGTLLGNTHLVGKNIVLLGAKSDICLDEDLFDAYLGMKAGVKSRLTRALSNTLGLIMSDVQTWEDGVNIGFRALQNSVEIATGLLLPVEGGIWVTGEAGYKRGAKCFQVAVLSTIKGGHFDISAEQSATLNGVKINTKSGSIAAQTLDVGAEEVSSSQSKTQVRGNIDVTVQGVGVGSATVQASHSESQASSKTNSEIHVDGQLKMDVSGKASFRGADVVAGELIGNFGDLLVESLKDDMQMTAGSASITIDPTSLSEIGKLFTGLGALSQNRKKSWVTEVTQLLGIDTAKIVVKKTIHLIGGMIANAERGKDGMLTDKGKLQVETAHLIAEDVESTSTGLLLGAEISRGIAKGFSYTAQADFGYTDMKGKTRAVFGLGDVKIVSDEQASFDALRDMHRNVSTLQSEQGIDIDPLHIYVPIPDFENLGAVKDFGEEVWDAAMHPARQIENSFRRIVQGMTWFVDDPRSWAPIENPRLRKLLDRVRVIGEEAESTGDEGKAKQAKYAEDAIKEVDSLEQIKGEVSDDAKHAIEMRQERLVRRVERLSEHLEGTNRKSPLSEERRELKRIMQKQDSFVDQPWAADAMNKILADARRKEARGQTDAAFAAVDEGWRFIDLARGVGRGALGSVKSYGEFLKKVATDPLSLATNTAYALTHLGEVYDAIREYVEHNVFGFTDLSADEQGQVIGELATDIVFSCATAGASAAGIKATKQFAKFMKESPHVKKVAGRAAQNAASGEKLKKNLASAQQMAEEGLVVAGPGSKNKFRGAERVAREYGGNPSDYVKKSSTSYKTSDGIAYETHWIENLKTGARFEFKTKFSDKI